MKQFITFLLSTFFFIVCSTAFAQVNNDEINIICFADGFSYPDNHSDEFIGTEENIIILYLDGTKIYDDHWQQNSPFTDDFQREMLDQNDYSSTSFTVRFDAWEHDSDPFFTENGGDDTPCGNQTITISPKNNTPLRQHRTAFNCTGAGNQSTDFRFMYRYASGDTEDDPLKFGTINDGETVTHRNRVNQFNSVTYGGSVSAHLEHSDDLNNSPFTDANEIIYTFTIDNCREVEIGATSNALTFHLANYNPTNEEVTSVIMTDHSPGSSPIKEFLVAGDYAVVMEGTSTNNVTLDITVRPFQTVDAGSIGYNGFTETFEGYDPPFLFTTMSPSGDITNYEWRKSATGTPGSYVAFNPNSPGQIFNPTADQLMLGDNYIQMRVWHDVCGNEDVSNDINIFIHPKNGFVDGTITAAGGGGPVAGVTVELRNLESIVGLGGPNTTVITETTNSSGQYQFSNFYVGDDPKSWRVTPSLGDHIFDPSNAEFDLYISTNSNTNERQDVDFVDESSFTYAGKIEHNINGQKCGMAGVVIMREYDGNGFVPIDTTDEDGNYSIAILNIGDWKVKPHLPGHTFSPLQFDGYIADDLFDQNFTDQTYRNLAINLKSGCDRFIGTATFNVKDTTSSTCFNESFDSNGGGSISENLAAKPYDIFLTDFTPVAGADTDIFNKPAVTSYFANQTIRVDLTHKDTILDLLFKPSPSITLQNWPAPPCDGLNHGVLGIHTSIPLILDIWEIPPTGLPNYPGCRLDTGLIIMTNHISSYENTPIVDSLHINEGQIPFILSGGVPNLAKPHTKSLTFDVFDIEGNNGLYTNQLIVEGNRPRESTFASVSPQIPLYILRDPPGDLSYSTVVESETFTSSTTFGLDISNNVHAYLQGVLDYEFGDNKKVWGNAGASIDYEGVVSDYNTTETSATVSTEFFTSEDQFKESIGTDADVFVGAAFNMKYALSDMVRLDPNRCEMKLNQELTIDPDSFATTFSYSHHFIKNTLIRNIRNDILPNMTDPDSLEYWNNQVRIWEATVRRNEELKEEASLIENFSFDGNSGAIIKSYTYDTARSISHEWSNSHDIGLFASFGGVYHGFGAEGGIEYHHQWTDSESKTTDTSNSLTIQYLLDDDELGDFFTVDVLEDPFYPTHVFRVKAAATSCPYEPGTQPRHEATLVANVNSQFNVPADEEAQYLLTITNNTQSGDTMPYFLDYNGTSNLENAEVSWDIQFESVQHLAPFETATFILDIGRNESSNTYAYEGIEFRVFAGCADGGSFSPDQNRVLASVKLNTYFQAPCSPITIAEPEQDWVVSQANNSTLDILLKDYDKTNMNTFFLQYAGRSSSSWTNIMQVPVASLNDNANLGTIVSWNTSNIPEGSYKIRANVNCANVVNYSTTVNGFIDNTSPFTVGYLFPEDHKLTSGNFIGLDINEPLSLTVNPDNVRLYNSLTGIEYEVQVVRQNQRLIVLPKVDLLSLEHASYNVEYIGIEDEYGNPLADTVTWWFTTGDFQPFTCDENTVFYVDKSLNRAFTKQDGSSWEDAFVTLGEALDVACPGSSIYVAEGTYYPTDHLYEWNSTVLDSIPGDSIYFEWTHSYHIFGGFPSGGSDIDERNPLAFPTVLSGDANKDGVPNAGDCHVIMHTREGLTSRMDGFVIEGSYGDGTIGLPYNGGTFFNQAPIDVSNCIFRNNDVGPARGGGWYNLRGSARLTNCLFENNDAQLGGGIYAGSISPDSLIVINCTFVGNSAAIGGSAVWSNGDDLHIRNCIFYDNALNDVGGHSGALITMENSSYQESSIPFPVLDFGSNMLSNDPSFVDEANHDYALQTSSNVIDMGDKNELPFFIEKDLAAKDRVMDAQLSPLAEVDMGAFETDPCSDITNETILYVDASMANDMSGLSWATPFKSLAKAMKKARNCGLDTIYVAAGVYLPASEDESDGREATFNIASGMVLMGGFPSGGGVRAPKVNLTLLSGNVGNPATNTDNVYHVVSMRNVDENTRLDGFTISNGFASSDRYGGGIQMIAEGYGNLNKPTIENCRLTLNFGEYGGAVAALSSNSGQNEAHMLNTVIEDNGASIHGGGIYEAAQTDGINILTLENVTISKNTATGQGGGAYIASDEDAQSLSTYKNCVIAYNLSDTNHAGSGGGGGMYLSDDALGQTEVRLENSIVHSNLDQDVPNQLYAANQLDTVLIFNSNIEGGFAGSNVLDVKPQFVGGHVGNFKLDACSPLVDAGNDGLIGGSKDLEGNDRSVGTIDIGAYEYDGISSRGDLPNDAEQIELHCENPVDFPLPSNGVTYRLFNEGMDILLDGPDIGDEIGAYLTNGSPVQGDTTMILQVGRDSSTALNFSGHEGKLSIPFHQDLLFDADQHMRMIFQIHPTMIGGTQKIWQLGQNLKVELVGGEVTVSIPGVDNFTSSGLNISENTWSEIIIDYQPHDDNTGFISISKNNIVESFGILDRVSQGSNEPAYIGGWSGSGNTFDGQMEYFSLLKNGRPILQYDFISGAGSDLVYDLRLVEENEATHTAQLEGAFDRYENWVRGNDAYNEICEDNIQLIVDYNPSTGSDTVIIKMDDGFGSLRYRVAQACPNDTIRFASVLMGDTIQFENEIFIGKDLVIQGLGMDANGTVLDGQGFTRLFDMPGDRMIEFKDLQMINGSHGVTGGAFEVPSACTLWNVRFKGHNSATNKRALDLQPGSNLEIKGNVEFEE